MIRFEHIEYLYFLLGIPVLMVLFIIAQYLRRLAIRKLGEPGVLVRLIPEASKSKVILKFIVMIIAYVLIVIGIANPQTGSRLEQVKRKGIDLVVALDVSNSMLAQDIRPDRLTRAKQALFKLIDRLEGDRIGIIIFAGKAYTQLPVTTDYAAAKMFVSTISTDDIPSQGTAIGEAIKLGINSFDDQEQSKAIIIITDGENHEDNAIESSQEAAEKGIRVYTIGMGLPDGSPIPLLNAYGRQTGFKKDRDGNTVITKLNEVMLQQIAAAGNGTYVRANNTQAGLSKIFEKINALEEREIETRMFTDYEDQFQYFIGFGLLLLLLEFFIFDRKTKWASNIRLFERKDENQ
ncbi:MAG: VWA domain-containing protein [Bacteroidales bacterium]|nr:VWA domain-containing protein [Bacteroidales bacterium]